MAARAGASGRSRAQTSGQSATDDAFGGGERNGANANERTIQEILSRNVEFFSINGNGAAAAATRAFGGARAPVRIAMSSCPGNHHPAIPTALAD